MFGASKMHLSSPVAKACAHSKSAVMLLLVHCLLLLPVFMGVLCLVIFSLFSIWCPF